MFSRFSSNGLAQISRYLICDRLLSLYMREDGKLFAAWHKVGEVGTIGFGEVEPERFWKFVNENQDKELR
jgi:hypothetical protein